MRTTTLFVDILIIGMLSFIWIMGVLFAFFLPANSFFTLLEKYTIVSAAALISIVYVLGILFDYTNAWVFEGFKSQKEKTELERISVIKIIKC